MEQVSVVIDGKFIRVWYLFHWVGRDISPLGHPYGVSKDCWVLRNLLVNEHTFYPSGNTLVSSHLTVSTNAYRKDHTCFLK